MTCLVCGRDAHDHRAHRDVEQVERHAQKWRRLGDRRAFLTLTAWRTHLQAGELLEQLRARKGAA